MKRVVVINTNGHEIVLPAVPNSEQLRRAVGGNLEFVRVIDPATSDGNPDFTIMIVNENGLLDDLPRNKRATEIYQRNVRLAFPDAPNPFRAAKGEWESRYSSVATVTDLTPEFALARGYEDDPWIAGTVVLFEGYTFDGADKAMDEANKRAKRVRE